MWIDAPNWAEVKAADAAYPAMVAAWVAAGAAIVAASATGCAAWFAWRALRWAKQAAEAAQEQIKVLEKQIALSEPQPVVIFRLTFTGWVGQTGWSLELENLGEELAFDVEVSPLYVGVEGVAKSFMLSFERFPVLKRAETRGYLCSVDPPISTLNETPPLSQPQRFLQLLLMGAERDAKGKGFGGVKNICIETITLKYRNSRGRQFEKEFNLWMREFLRLEALPRGLLVSETDPAGV